MNGIKKRLFVLMALTTIIAATASAQSEDFTPSFHTGVLMHSYVGIQQKGFGSSLITADDNKWDTDFTLYRARIMTEAFLTKNDYLFLETELTSPLGTGSDKAAGIKILDAQYNHTFGNFLTTSIGKMLVSHNRNGLQTASTLMVNDFTYFQYAYNMSAASPLQNDLGRDVGVNLSGGFVQDKLKYKLGFFAGNRDFETNILRTIGRVEYNFLDIDKYSGTNLGAGQTITIAGGFDTQGDYLAAGGDVFVDYPLGNGSITLNGALSYITGGNDLASAHSFAGTIPTQNTQLLELGYYIKPLKLQPWVRYERQDVNSEEQQRGGLSAETFDQLNTTNVLGGGLSYFFNDYTTNVKLSYVSMQKGVLDPATGGVSNKSYGQVWLQLQLCLF